MFDDYALQTLIRVTTSKYYLVVYEDFVCDANGEAVGIKETWYFNAFGYKTSDTELMFQEGTNSIVDAYMQGVVEKAVSCYYADALKEFEGVLQEIF